jgi:hypothetical protein
MPCDDLPDDLKILWKEAGVTPTLLSLEQLRQGTERLQAGRRKSEIALVAANSAFVAFFMVFFFLFDNTLTRIGSILSVFGCGYWLVHILVEQARAVPDLGETDGVRFYRAELERVRDYHRGTFWRWLILPPPLIFFNIGLAQTYAGQWPFLVPFMWFDCAFILAFFAVIAPLKQLRLARRYQGRIDALDAAVRSSGQADRNAASS